MVHIKWADLWDDILDGGDPRWKVDDLVNKEIALQHIYKHSSSTRSKNGNGDLLLNIFCPLAGDDLFVHYAWSKGHAVTAADMVPTALEAMRKQFSEGSWSKEEQQQGETTVVCWKHDSGRATLYETDILKPIPELFNKFDVVYDKDSFVALNKDKRTGYCQRLADYTKVNGIIYTEVVFKSENHPDRFNGPAFSVTRQDLMEVGSFGGDFDYLASLGELYEIPMPHRRQMGHVMKRKPTEVLTTQYGRYHDEDIKHKQLPLADDLINRLATVVSAVK